MKSMPCYIEDLAYWSINNDIDNINNNGQYLDNKELYETVKLVNEKLEDENVMTFLKKIKEMNKLIKNIILTNYFEGVDSIKDKEDDAQDISNYIVEEYVNNKIKKKV